MTQLNFSPVSGTFHLTGEYLYDIKKIRFRVIMYWDYTNPPVIYKIEWTDPMPLHDRQVKAEGEIREMINNQTRVFNIIYQ